LSLTVPFRHACNEPLLSKSRQMFYETRTVTRGVGNLQPSRPEDDSSRVSNNALGCSVIILLHPLPQVVHICTSR
jgi:hypothetical protein